MLAVSFWGCMRRWLCCLTLASLFLCQYRNESAFFPNAREDLTPTYLIPFQFITWTKYNIREDQKSVMARGVGSLHFTVKNASQVRRSQIQTGSSPLLSSQTVVWARGRASLGSHSARYGKELTTNDVALAASAGVGIVDSLG